MTSNGNCKYSCATATETLEWIRAIVDFINPYSFFWDSHVVNFLTHELWKSVDKEWIDCLKNEPVEYLVQIPSGFVQDHWPSSLKKFITTSSSLAFPREQADLEKVLPNMQVALLNAVITQGMNPKKKHEIEALAGVVSSVARDVETNTVIDVGAGQGYLAQVLSFEYQLSVIAVDSSSHHGTITDTRAQRIKKHYDARKHKSRFSRKMPKTVTCCVLSSDMLKGLLAEQDTHIDMCCSSVLLTGLHACGDLSVTMLRTFLDCEQVKAVVSIGCCYNLLSEEEEETVDDDDDDDDDDDLCGSGFGFPLSRGVKSSGLHLRRNARDLACQSADRWRGLGKDESLHNFMMHAFRAAFQMVLSKYFPETLTTSPTIGRQGKAFRRIITNNVEDRCSLFEKFSESAMHRLNLNNSKSIDFAGMWKKAEPFYEVIGAYWSLRAALGPVLETLILLDRLLFLQEQGVEAFMLPIFDPTLSPRNIALIATKSNKRL